MSEFETWEEAAEWLDVISERCEILEYIGFDAFVEMTEEGPLMHIYGRS